MNVARRNVRMRLAFDQVKNGREARIAPFQQLAPFIAGPGLEGLGEARAQLRPAFPIVLPG